jgi:hypothetical protein
MLSYKKLLAPVRITVFASLLVIGLTACGFKPLYTTASGNTAAGAAEQLPFDQISISHMANREGQYLRNRLIDTIYIKGRPVSPRYKLHISQLSEEIIKLGIRKDASATRAQMRISAQMTLTDTTGETHRVVLRRNLETTNSFNILSSQYTTQVTEQYARERTLDEMSRKTVRQLALYFNRPDYMNETDLSAN